MTFYPSQLLYSPFSLFLPHSLWEREKEKDQKNIIFKIGRQIPIIYSSIVITIHILKNYQYAITFYILDRIKAGWDF